MIGPVQLRGFVLSAKLIASRGGKVWTSTSTGRREAP